MKKIVALLLCAVLLISTMPVFAAQEDSQKMQEVLLIVKGKIEIPEELSEFSGDGRLKVILFDGKSEREYRLEELLPLGFELR